MATFKSPYAPTTSLPGVGEAELSLLPPGKQALTRFSYQYPLKLVAPDPHTNQDDKHVTVVFLLTYGGGLVGGDEIDLKVTLHNSTRLALLTQGSTKIFKSPSPTTTTRQTLNVRIAEEAALCYLPDPNQPFAESVFEQNQTFYVEPTGKSNLLVLDWVTEGRRARGESWTLWSWKGRNEVREFDLQSRGRLLLRDTILLHEGDLGSTLAQKTNHLGIVGTLIVYGLCFQQLAQFILQQFADQPRIGAKKWTADTNANEEPSQLPGNTKDNVLWTAASVRGFVLVKFAAVEIDDARRWLGSMLKKEGTVEREFGHQALLCLK